MIRRQQTRLTRGIATAASRLGMLPAPLQSNSGILLREDIDLDWEQLSLEYKCITSALMLGRTSGAPQPIFGASTFDCFLASGWTQSDLNIMLV